MPSLTTLHIIGSKEMGGAERFCFRLVAALNQAGIPSTLVVRRGSQVARQARTLGLPHREALMKTVWDPISKASISRAIGELRPSVVQTYMGRATRLTRLRKGALPVHVSRLGGYYKLDGYRHAHAWIGNTQGICRYLRSHGFPEERVFHVSNFIEIPGARPQQEIHRLRRSLDLPPEAWILLTAGRFIEVKGHLHLIEALARLKKVAGRAVVLVIIGDGPLRSSYMERAAALGVADRLWLPGWQDDPLPFFQLADLVVFPSEDRETLGNVILEAWASRRPVVATRFRGAREITSPGEDALLADCGDPAGLAQAVEQALADSVLRKRLAEAGHRKVVESFSKEAVVARYCELYHRLSAEVSP